MCRGRLGHLVNHARQARLQVGGLVAVNNVGLGQLVKHFLDAGIKFRSLVLVGHSADFTHSITHGLGVILVMKLPFLVLADSLV